MEESKLDVVVGMNVQGKSARIKVGGHVDTRNISGLYEVARRAGALAPQLEVVVDLSQATATPAAWKRLRQCESRQSLPAPAGGGATPCNLSLVSPAPLAGTVDSDVALAA